MLLPIETMAASTQYIPQFRGVKVLTAKPLRSMPAAGNSLRVSCRVSPSPERIRPSPERKPSTRKEPGESARLVEELRAQVKVTSTQAAKPKREKKHYVNMVVKSQQDEDDSDYDITCDRRHEFPMLVLMRHGEQHRFKQQGVVCAIYELSSCVILLPVVRIVCVFQVASFKDCWYR